MESATIGGISEESGKKINNICSMSWLKNNSQSAVENCLEMKEIIPKTKNIEDYIPETKSTKKIKSKRFKKLSSVKENSKHPDTHTEQLTKKHGKRDSTPLTNITDSSSASAWNANVNTATALFPNVQHSRVELLDEEVIINAVLEESVITAELEQFKLTAEEHKVNWADDSEDPGWDTTRRNLPDLCEEKDKDTEKKSQDDNNNSENKPGTAAGECLNIIDKYGRVGGFNERHLFMGKGARMKEQNIIGQLQHKGSSHQRSPNPTDEKSSSQQYSRTNSYDNKNKGFWDFKGKTAIDNRSSNCDDKKDHKNRNSQFINQRGKISNQSQTRQDSHIQRYNEQSHRYNYQHHRNPNQPHRYEDQLHNQEKQSHRYDIRSNKNHTDDSMHKSEIKTQDPEKLEDDNTYSAHESEYDRNNTAKNQNLLEKDTQDQLKESESQSFEQNLNNSSTPITEDGSSLCFMQDSFKDEQNLPCESPVQNIHPEPEIQFEKVEYQEKVATTGGPFPLNVMPIPIQVQHPSRILCPDGSVQIRNEIPYFPVQNIPSISKQSPSPMNHYNIVTNPYISAAHSSHPPLLQPQHTHEIVTSDNGCTAVPIQNLDMRFFHPHPFNVVHNHPVNSFAPIPHPPIGIPMQPCSHPSQIPVGNVQGMNFMHQNPGNCSQCVPHYYQTPRIPVQNLNCQHPIYPQFMTPPAVPMTPVNQEQLIFHPEENFQSANNEKFPTPERSVRDIGRSVNNLVNLCETLPSRRGGYSTNSPPGFESSPPTNAGKSQKKIISKKQQVTLPAFRNNPIESTLTNSMKDEEFTDELLNDVRQEISLKSQKKKDSGITSKDCPEMFIKFGQDSYYEDIVNSPSNTDGKLSNPNATNTQAPRPGFRVGVGRGKRLGHTN